MIYERNMEVLRELGAVGWQALATAPSAQAATRARKAAAAKRKLAAAKKKAAQKAAQAYAASHEDARVVTVPGSGPITVEVRGYRYTPQGLMYELTPLDPAHQNAVWRVVASALQPFHGETKMMQANLVTGETKPLP